MLSSSERQALLEQATRETAGIKDEAVARVLIDTLVTLRTEYISLAKQNRGLILKFSRQTRALLAVLFVCMLPLGVISIRASDRSAKASDRSTHVASIAVRLGRDNAALAVQANANAEATNRAVASIQTNRRELTLENCRAQDRQHFKARRDIELLARTAPKRPGSPAEAAEQQRVISGLTNAFVPYVNCKAKLRKVR